MADIDQARRALIARILKADGTTSLVQRGGAFENAGLSEPLRSFVAKVTKDAHAVTRDDIAGLRASGLSEDQIFEIAVCAAVGEAQRQYDMAFAALEAAGAKE
jgi:hypothetical protein